MTRLMSRKRFERFSRRFEKFKVVDSLGNPGEVHKKVTFIGRNSDRRRWVNPINERFGQHENSRTLEGTGGKNLKREKINFKRQKPSGKKEKQNRIREQKHQWKKLL